MTNFDLKHECGLLKAQVALLDKELIQFENYKFWFTDWVYHKCHGEFSTAILDKEFDIKSKFQKECRNMAINSMIKDNIIKTAGKKHGHYKLVESDLKQMNFVDAPGTPISNFWLPMNIHQMVKIFPGNIIQINGEKNSGKTAFVLNIIKGNMHQHRCVYFNSEMGEDELRTRLALDKNLSVSSWNFAAYERSGDFSDVIIPGEGNINIIDFLEIHDEFYKMGEYMRDIHDKLKGAIAIIVIQKNPGNDSGLGGARTEEKPRLIINLRPGVIKIKMAKNWVGENNPNGLCVKFKLARGIFFKQVDKWYYEQKQ